MNKLLSVFAILGMMISSPALAKDRDRDHRDRGNNSGFATGVVAGVVGSIILREVTKDRRDDRHWDNRRDDRRDNRHWDNRRDDRRWDNNRRDYRNDYRRCQNVHLIGLRGYRGQLIVDGGREFSYQRVSNQLCLDGRSNTIVHDRNGNNRFDWGDGYAEVRGGTARFHY